MTAGWFHRRWVKKDGTEVVYSHHYPARTAFGRCRRYLRRPGAALVPTGHCGRWVGAGDIQFQNKTVRHLIELGFAELCADGAIRKKGRL